MTSNLTRVESPGALRTSSHTHIKVTGVASRPSKRINNYTTQGHNLFLTFSRKVRPRSERARTSAVVQKRTIRMQKLLDDVNVKLQKDVKALEKEVNTLLDTLSARTS